MWEFCLGASFDSRNNLKLVLFRVMVLPLNPFSVFMMEPSCSVIPWGYSDKDVDNLILCDYFK